MNKVQSDFLNELKDEKVAVTVFLINGVKLQGIITLHDDESLLLRRDGHTQLVYKHAISTIMPGVAVAVSEQYFQNNALKGYITNITKVVLWDCLFYDTLCVMIKQIIKECLFLRAGGIVLPFFVQDRDFFSKGRKKS